MITFKCVDKDENTFYIDTQCFELSEGMILSYWVNGDCVHTDPLKSCLIEEVVVTHRIIIPGMNTADL